MRIARRFLSFVLLYAGLVSAEELQVPLADGDTLQVQMHDADGTALMLVIPSEHGLTPGLNELAADLSEQGVEVWIADPFSTWFLPTVTGSLSEIPTAAYVDLIEHAAKTGKRLYLMANDRGAGLLLQAAHTWQREQRGVLDGVILISPDLYVTTPGAGQEGELLPVVGATDLPIFIFVPGNSVTAVRVQDKVEALQRSGSDVYVQLLPELRNRFYFRRDATAVEQQAAARFAERIVQSMRMTQVHAQVRIPPAIVADATAPPDKMTGVLRPYQGVWRPQDFKLPDMQGHTHSLAQYRGRVVLVNFWATWCPPCIHEIPSMNALYQDHRDRPFEILAINLGEAPADVARFLAQHPVDFPVLLGSLKGLPREWRLFAFPTSYLLDKSGVVRYSVAGAIDWTAEASRAALDTLLTE